METSGFFWHIANTQLCTDCYSLGGGEGTHNKHYYYKTVNNCRVLFCFLNLTFPPLIMDSLSSYEQFKFILTVVSIRIKAV